MVRCCGATVVLAAVVVVAARAAAARYEDDGDTAEFVVAVEGGGTRCAGALVALRAALTSARCARSAELWVRAPHAAPAVRVLRVAVADLHAETEAGSRVAGAEGEWVWGGVGADLALLELAETVRGARPILAAAGGECAPRASCFVPRTRARRLRVVAAALEPAVRCVSRGARWPSPLQERALCLLGARLCRDDWGAAVVCGGKLCGVLSRSAQSDERDEEDAGNRAAAATNETQCGDTHAAASVPRAHRFMRCAMLRGACGRGECERVCAERWLHDEPATKRTPAPAPAPCSRPHPMPPPSARRASATHRARDDDNEDSLVSADSTSSIAETRTRASTVVTAETGFGTGAGEYVGATDDAGAAADVGATEDAGVGTDAGAAADAGADAREEAGAGAGTSAAGAVVVASPGPSATTAADASTCGATRTSGSFEFEPNRADFKMTPARTSAVCLKAGEYGDNAAEYGAGEEGGTCGPASTPSRTPPPSSERRAEVEARLAADTTPALAAGPAPPLADVAARRRATSRAPSPSASPLSLLSAAASCILSVHH